MSRFRHKNWELSNDQRLRIDLMDTTFYIVFTLKTLSGPETFARYYMGEERERADEIFGRLKGTEEVNEKNLLHIEFMETRDGLPVNLRMISCTLDQLGENCKILTRELFKLYNCEGLLK